MEPQPNQGLHVRYALWATVPASRQPFWQQKQGTAYVSAVVDGSVSAGETSALQSGSVVEKVVESEWPPGTTVGQAETFLQQAATAWQTFITNYNPWAHYGTFFDDSTNTWTMKAVA